MCPGKNSNAVLAVLPPRTEAYIYPLTVFSPLVTQDIATKEVNPTDIDPSRPTVVVVDDKIIGKPTSVVEARKMIHMLEGRSHEVYTGVALLTLQDGRQDRGRTFHDKTVVHVGKLDEIELEEYITSKEPYDKAGGYGIQGAFAKYITGIEGDYYNVVGLPVHLLYQELKKLGIRL